MARGFWTGLLHGGVIAILALAGLSLLAPLPGDDAAQVPPSAPTAAPAADPARTAPASEPAAPADAVQAGTVDLPVGSEFGRGGDLPPRLPGPLQPEKAGQSDAPAVIAPASEPAPVAVTAADPRPQPAGQASGPVQAAPATGEPAPKLDRPAALPSPGIAAVPVRVDANAPDAAPVLPEPETAAPAAQAAPRPTPGLAAPALDLSLPPDLSELQGLRND